MKHYNYMMHVMGTYCKQSWSHVMFHVDIIKGHNLDEALKGSHSYS